VGSSAEEEYRSLHKQGVYNVSILVFGEPVLPSPYKLQVVAATPAMMGGGSSVKFAELDSLLAEYGA
jgi:hypothetical protein